VAAPSAVSPAALLPAPLLFLRGGQLWQLERDGATLRQLTREILPIREFDVGRGDGALAYLLGDADGGAPATLVYVSPAGTQRIELATGPLSRPRIEPAGERIAFQLYEPIQSFEIGKEGSATGVWVVPKLGGRPSVLQPSEPISDQNNPPDDARQYFPIDWSPDGSQLLIGVYYPVGEGGRLTVKHMSDGALVDLDDGCCEAQWSVDGAAVTIAGGTQIQDAYLGLWRADPISGKTTTLVASPTGDKSALITAARELGDGTTYAFLTFMADPPYDRPIPVTMQRIGRDGKATALRSDSYALTDALWAEDGSGAVIVETTANLVSGPLLWLPADGGTAVKLPADGAEPRWGMPDSIPAATACPLGQPLVWQPPAQRTAAGPQAPQIKAVQARLLALGYADVGAADGLFGDATREAVRAFQQTSGLAATGEVDCATALALFDAAAPQKP
jgi:hypothetical protein